MKKQLLPVLWGFFIMGFCDLVGVSTSYVQREFSLSEALAGLIPSMVFLWFLLLAVPVALLMTRTGRKRMVLAGDAVTFLGMLVPFFHFTFAGCLIGFALLGIGNTMLQVSLNPLLTNVVDGKALSSSLTAGQVVKAVSSFSGPFIATWAALRLGDWRLMFPVFAGLSLLSALWLGLTPIREEQPRSGASFRQVFALLGDRRILFLFVGIVCIVGVDVGLNTFAPKVLMERGGLPVERAGLGSSVYFFCRVAGAFLGTFLLTKLSDARYYRLHAGAGLAVLAGLAFARSTTLLLVLIGAAGYCYSSLFAVLYAEALKRRPERADEISGLMVTGVFGGALVPPLMGLAADGIGSQTGSLLVLGAFALYLYGQYYINIGR